MSQRGQTKSLPPGATSLRQGGDSLSEEGFHSLCFYDFVEFLYLSAQYRNPDPFINPNQKFADFVEKTVLVHA